MTEFKISIVVEKVDHENNLWSLLKVTVCVTSKRRHSLFLNYYLSIFKLIQTINILDFMILSFIFIIFSNM